ncbi:DoxX family protein [Hoeflea sp.]|uniref:DoxX family protein n=1 Tax=Hoeflea sp. TaxID=1940281 RepID=UPI0037479D9D
MATAAAPANLNGVSKGANIGIWIAQVLGAAAFIMAGVMKLGTPIPELSAMMPWTGEYSETFVRMIGAIDLAGGLGLLLPSLTRIMPRLTVIAAACCVLLQIIAIVFHASRGEFMVLPTNAVYIALSLIVLWGRGRKAPIAPRS